MELLLLGVEDVVWSWVCAEISVFCEVCCWFVLAAVVLESTDVELDEPTTTGVVAVVVLVVVVSVATVSDDRVL